MAARGCEFWPVRGGGYFCSQCYNKIEPSGNGHSLRCVCAGQSPPVEAAAAAAAAAASAGGSSSFSANYGGAAATAGGGGGGDSSSSSSSSSGSSPIARAGEQQVFKIILEVGKCYEHIEATRYVYMGGENRTYFSTNQPVYVGKYLRDVRVGGYGDGAEIFAIFQNPEEEKTIRISVNTCFVEVPCKLDVDISSKARDQAVRNIYEKATGESAAPGTGPANLIRAFAGIKVPKGAEGGRRSGHRRKTHRKQRRQQKQKNRRSRKN